MESKHTPGPWKAALTFANNEPERYGIFAPSENPKRFNGELIATADTEANAALIAAAPEMYEAIRAYFEDLDNPSTDLTAVRNAMSAALAKAEGRA